MTDNKNTRSKLKEAEYFLQELLQRKDDYPTCLYLLSAFLSAWKSVLDVMLYDFVNFYPLGLENEDKISDRDFWVAANALGNRKALQFIKWWRQKAHIIGNHSLSRERNRIVHKGYPPYELYTPSTLSSGVVTLVSGQTVAGFSGPIPTDTYTTSNINVEFLDILEDCKNGFELIQGIVKEAEREFNINF